MKVSSKTMIVGAAMAGLFTGTAVRAHAVNASSSTIGSAIHQLADSDKNSCKGQNACKGKGGCKTTNVSSQSSAVTLA